MSMLDGALALTKRGFHVFPLLPRDKIPFKGSRGFREATNSKTQIRQWWKQTPEANIGVKTGFDSGVLVVDVDPRHRGDLSIKTLTETQGELPETLTVKTGSGGTHLYYAHPGVRVRNSVNKLGEGIDVRCDGGYVVAPPSVHPCGDCYRFAVDVPMAQPPDWLVIRLTETQSARMSYLCRSVSLPSLSVEQQVAWAIRSSVPSGPGNRNQCLFVLARKIKAVKPDATSDDLEEILAEWFRSQWSTSEPRTSLLAGLISDARGIKSKSLTMQASCQTQWRHP